MINERSGITMSDPLIFALRENAMQLLNCFCFGLRSLSRKSFLRRVRERNLVRIYVRSAALEILIELQTADIEVCKWR